MRGYFKIFFVVTLVVDIDVHKAVDSGSAGEIRVYFVHIDETINKFFVIDRLILFSTISNNTIFNAPKSVDV